MAVGRAANRRTTCAEQAVKTPVLQLAVMPRCPRRPVKMASIFTTENVPSAHSAAVWKQGVSGGQEQGSGEREAARGEGGH